MPKVERWSRRKKVEIVLRLLRGESLEAMSRETGKGAHELSEWREAFLAAGETAFAAASKKVKHAAVTRLERKVGEMTIENELLYEKIARLENGVPFHLRRSKK